MLGFSIIWHLQCTVCIVQFYRLDATICEMLFGVKAKILVFAFSRKFYFPYLAKIFRENDKNVDFSKNYYKKA